MPELVAILEAKREQDHTERKFMAALQGVDIDKNKAAQNEWESLKARVYSKGKTSDPNDIVALQGDAALRAGFGIGMGLDYEVIE
jgi:translation initiation factor 1 (eIF-1/SUI1)